MGAHVGAPLGDAADAASVTLGIDAAYMWNITKGLDIGVTTGYSHFFLVKTVSRILVSYR
ncbi:hypothetical protein ACFOEQ_04170 [Chryseobacterium arachidis]|uniref:hypothetical protein n=1 Tax=Chryseobacterium arachidis TaxID=1416778 RepID=UPI0036245013